VKRIPVSPTMNVVALDDNDFVLGTLYLLKYLPDDKLSRKNPWIKILYK
jgi:hypothetical protein